MANREDILDDFIIEEDMSHATLRAYIERYPDRTKDLLDVFHECVMIELETASPTRSEETTDENT